MLQGAGASGGAPSIQGLLGNGENYLVAEAVRGLLAGEKAKPGFVHAAPKGDEVGRVCEQLLEKGFSVVQGQPGEGKSMTALQAAHRPQEAGRYMPYMIRVDLLGGGALLEPGFGKVLRTQLDGLEVERKWKIIRKPNLVIIDNAHTLASPTRPYDEVARFLGLVKGSIEFIRGRCLEQLRRKLERAGLAGS